MNAINWHSCFFLLFALIACASAVAVVVTGNIVRMACYLVVSLAAVAGLFFLAGADFLGAVQLMVYVGGTMVLLVFGVMLTARGPFVSMATGGGQWIMATIIGGSLLAVLLQAAFSISDWTAPASGQGDLAAVAPTATRLGLGLLGVRVDRGMCGHLLAFEIISVHLVVVLIGAAYLARARRRVQRSAGEPQNVSPRSEAPDSERTLRRTLGSQAGDWEPGQQPES
jgi:NADH-quinone oxidoreductase subunit J